MNSAMLELRARTTEDHKRVDAVFDAYELTDRVSYGAFLSAHARALPAAEAVIVGAAASTYQLRTPLLHADLKNLKQSIPCMMSFSIPNDSASAWGAAYVVQGSRIGGALLAARVAANLPKTYLAAKHGRGEWRAFGEALNLESQTHGHGWLDRATISAKACFDLYRRAGSA